MAPAKTVLLIGFEPFDGEEVNPSAGIVAALDGEVLHDHRIVTCVLAVAFAPTVQAITTLIEQHQPALVVGLGLAGGRTSISIERVAVNLIDARIADNAGSQPIDQAVVTGAPDAYFSTLPVKAIEASLRQIGIPAAVSMSAGTYVCNQAMFALLHVLNSQRPRTRGGFIHVPWLPVQASRHPGQPSMALETMIAGVRAALECAISTGHDLRVRGGATH